MKQAILITYHDQDSLSEAKELCTAADYNVAHIIRQEFLKRAKFGITASKIDEIKELISTIKPDVIIFDERLDDIVSILMNSKTRKAWICPQCKETNLISETPSTNKEYKSNATFGCIYEKPKYSLDIRASYDRLCMIWLTCFLREIDMGLMAFQKEYFEQNGTGMKEDIKSISHNI